MNPRLLSLLAVLALAPAVTAEEERASTRTPSRGPTAAQLEACRAAGARVRWDPLTGNPATIRLDEALDAADATPDAAARRALAALAGLFAGGDPGPTLGLVRVERLPGERTRVTFAQCAGGVAIEGGELAVYVERPGERTRVRSLSGRVHSHVPTAVQLPSGWPEGMLIADGRGAWRLARPVAALDDGLPGRRWVGVDGAVLRREVMALPGGVTADVHDVHARGPTRRAPLPDLYVAVAGQRAVTDPQGRFPGDEADLPWGLSGPHHHVVGRAGPPLPGTTSGALHLGFSRQDPRLHELMVFHHLGRLRRFYATLPVPARIWDRTVAAIVRAGDQQVAHATPSPTTIDGQVFDGALTFGALTALDASAIGHEHAHLLLHAAGLTTYSNDLQAITEGYADFLGAAGVGTPVVCGRALDEDVVHPTAPDAPHRVALPLSGALWDARRELGAAAVVPVVLEAAGAHADAATLPDAAVDLLAAAPPAVAPVLRRHLARHGLLPGAADRPPAIELDPDLRLGIHHGRSEILAWDPADVGPGPPSRVRLLVAAPPFVTVAPAEAITHVTGAGQRVRAVRRVLSMPPRSDALAGAYELVVTAETDAGESADRRSAVAVLPAGGASPSDGSRPVELEVAVGATRRVDLTTLFAPVGHGALGFHLLDALPSGVALVDRELVVAGTSSNVGAHEFRVLAEHVLLPSSEHRLASRPVRLVVRAATAGLVGGVTGN